MSTPKSSTKSKNNVLWHKCEKCGTIIHFGDNEKHLVDCPPNPESITHYYIKNQCLFGNLNVKNNEEMKGSTSNFSEHVVYLSQSVFDLCGLAIGDRVVIKVNTPNRSEAPLVKRAWPTNERSLTSVHLIKKVLDLYFGEVKSYPNVSVEKLTQETNEAIQISVKTKATEISQDIEKRLNYLYKESILTIGSKLSIFYYGRVLKFTVEKVLSKEGDLVTHLGELNITDKMYEVTDKTKWVLYKEKNTIENIKNSISKVGGLSEQIKKIKMLIANSLALDNNEQRTRSVLLYGNPGTGKTMLANAIAKDSKVNIMSINPDLYKKPPVPPEQTIHTIFENAVSNGPTVMIIDEIEKMCPAAYSKISDSEKRVMATLLLLLDKLHDDENAKVFIICTTNKIDSIDPRFRRIGRLDCEIEIPVPNPESRRDILEKLLGKFEHHISEEQMLEVSTATHGFVGLDLEALCYRAKDHAYDNSRNSLQFDDLKHAMKDVKASAMREVQVEVPNVKWSDIGGQENLKKILKQSVEWPLKHSESFLRIGITPPKGVLMYGPPGCSKTMIARAVATESGLNFLSIKGAELLSKWVGDSEKAVIALFKKAREVAPSVIFFDEIDVIAGERSSGSSTNVVQERVLTQLLLELDGVTPLGDVVVLAATNRPDRIDDALLRPGRFDRIVYVPLPDDQTRMEIFKLKLSKIPVEDVDIGVLVDSTKNYSGAEINGVCNVAAMKALEEDIINAAVVKMKHFEMALKKVIPRTKASLIKLYEEFESNSIDQ